MSTRARVFFIGPLPPPVHGFSEINRRMLTALRQSYQVEVFDTRATTSVVRPLRLVASFVWRLIFRRPASVYLALSGGLRQWIDLAYLLAARARRVPVYVHHHSFAYLTQRRLSTAACLAAVPEAVHVVLCDCMGEQLGSRYGRTGLRTRALSNAAFLNALEQPPERCQRPSDGLRVGFLSNITAEKGIFEFFGVMRSPEAVSLGLQAVVAGPVETAISTKFAEQVSQTRGATHVGAVYGADKRRFFESIDVLLFPTRYANEAEPVTILEALAHGVPVIAFDRGCIASMLPAEAGSVFAHTGNYVSDMLGALRPLATDPIALSNARRAARAAFEQARATHSQSLDRLITQMGVPPQQEALCST